MGVNLFGVTNWLRALKSLPPYWQSQWDALFAEIKKNNVSVEYVIFPDEGHGFVKKEMRSVVGYGKILEFLNQYLKEEKFN